MKNTMLCALALATLLLGVAFGVLAQGEDDPNSPNYKNPVFPKSYPVRTCPDNQVVRGLNGVRPICVPASCPSGYFLRGVTNNQPVCDPNVGWGVKCNGNQVLQGFDASGNAVCVDAPAGAQGPQGPAGIAGAGLWLARGTGCGACPYGPVDGNAVSYCKVKDQAGNLRAVKFVGYGCSPVQSFAFWTY